MCGGLKLLPLLVALVALCVALVVDAFCRAIRAVNEL